MSSRSLAAQAGPGWNTMWPQRGQGLTASVTLPRPASRECHQYLSAASHGCPPLGQAIGTRVSVPPCHTGLCSCSGQSHPHGSPTGFGGSPVLSFPHLLHRSPLASQLLLLLSFVLFLLPEGLWLSGANSPIVPSVSALDSLLLP